MSEPQYASNKAIFAACLLAAAGALVFNAFPQVLTAIAIQYELGEAEVGSLISAYMGGFALLALFAPLWMKALPWKPTAIVAYGVLGAGVVLLDLGGKALVSTAMFIMGLGACVIFTISVGIIAAARDPDRGFGLKLTAEMIVGAVLIFVVAKLIAEQFGYQGFVYGSLGLYALSSIAILWLPNSIDCADDRPMATGITGHNWQALSAALAMFICFAAFTAVWGFAGHIGLEQGHSEAQISTVLTLALLSGLGGALCSAWLGKKVGHLKPLVLGMVLTVLAFLALVQVPGLIYFAIAVCLINALLQFVLAYQMGLLADLDHSGRYTSMIAFILASSAALSGDLMGSLIESQGLLIAVLLAAAAVVSAMLLTLAAMSKRGGELSQAMGEG